MIYGLQYGQNGSKFRTILWSHGLQTASSPETYYGLVLYGLSPSRLGQLAQTIYGLIYLNYIILKNALVRR